MTGQNIVAKELANILKVIAHPDRIRLMQELRERECDVNTLIVALKLPGPRMSQHLALLRAHRLVDERREGRRHVYHLMQPEIVDWILQGVDFVGGPITHVSKAAIKSTEQLWR